MENLSIYCPNLDEHLSVPPGATLYQVAQSYRNALGFEPVNARVNNLTVALDWRLRESCQVEFVGLTEESGRHTYLRSLCLLFAKALHDELPHYHLSVRHSLSGGYFSVVRCGDKGITDEQLALIKRRIDHLIAEDLPFERRTVPAEEAVQIFTAMGEMDKVDLITSSGQPYVTYHYLDGYPDNYYGSLLLSTGQVQLYDLVPYLGGVLIRVPSIIKPTELAPFEPQQPMREVFDKQSRLLTLLDVSYVGSLNKAISTGHFSEIVQVAEAAQEKEIAAIATEIAEAYNQKGVRIVLVAGPSSSGKTTFTKRLRLQLMANYLRPHQISLDNYFVSREFTPLDDNGEYDFEHIEALDLELFASDLRRLLAGELVDMPLFDFTQGARVYQKELLQLGEGDLLLIEGIHALNPRLIPEDLQPLTYNIYISALTALGLDAHNRIPSTDIRLLRRMVRDHNYRGYSAIDTISRWRSVRAGEERWIFPYQNRANVLFNSALLYEVAVLKTLAEQILYQVPACVKEYSEARRLLRFLDHVRPAPIDEIPSTSLLREFIGGSSFHY